VITAGHLGRDPDRVGQSLPLGSGPGQLILDVQHLPLGGS
jgi:hypothetical protein